MNKIKEYVMDRAKEHMVECLCADEFIKLIGLQKRTLRKNIFLG